MRLRVEYSMLFPHNNRTGKQNWVTDMGQFPFIKQVNGLGIQLEKEEEYAKTL